ncbi:exodeoxyribonuclease III [Candidatus Finniella inopinata]|uniref:Exodeoxyribonuclease III n=1 Tax=Candidatus Finniella inopinata TaxID=1696036 RepID=A0A4Q7DGR5_9PROT|nr:exodeoxyribonuclease III [Candidatus Finniella inopinata]RZI45398.1 exodeoxyribonuclease III [Candidatus Finniella inopinata]
MKIVTWNVNSIRVRLPNVTRWLNNHQPDVVLLQELKCLNEAFPRQELEDLGYNVAVHGQKTYNGVAILSKSPIEDITYGLPNFSEDLQARYIEAVVGKVRVASVYIPNGQEVGSPAYVYKMAFLGKLHSHLQHLLTYDEACVIGGDYNIAPTDQDVYDAGVWADKVLCSKPERKAFQALCHLGYQDAVRLRHPGVGPFTWWDYRAGAFLANKGLRIDHLLLSPLATDRLQDCGVDAAPRADEKASDHAPVWCTLNV